MVGCGKMVSVGCGEMWNDIEQPTHRHTHLSSRAEKEEVYLPIILWVQSYPNIEMWQVKIHSSFLTSLICTILHLQGRSS
jgi:hypothetical protein